LAIYRDRAIVALLVGLAASALVGGLLARRALRPLARLTRVARAVRATDLRPHASDVAWPSELAELARTFDQMLDRIDESFKRLSQFSADIAHELRTPLNILRGEAEVALGKARCAEEYRAVLESSIEEYDRLGRMLESLLFLARSDNADLPLERKHIALGNELAAICEFFDAVAAEKQVALSHMGSGDLMADPMLFRRAVVNLVSNASRRST
jgi:two-component system heavy metal sensor histidine kinase CusS